MPTYELDISLTKSQVNLFNQIGANIVIAKPALGSPSNVAWQVFHPLETNEVEWEEKYGIYASSAELKNGAKLTQMSQTSYPALDGKIYPFLSTGTFGGPASGGEAGTFYSVNDYDNEKGYLTFGLYQAASVNGNIVKGNAISAAPVLRGNNVAMTPYTTLFVWLQSQVFSNTVVTDVTSPKTEVVFGAATSKIALGYDDQGHFVAKQSAELAEGASVQTRVPTLL